MNARLFILIFCSLAFGVGGLSMPSPAAEAEGEAAVAAEVDAIFRDWWLESGVRPAPEITDELFLRRIWLDLAGVAPTAAAVREYAGSTDSDKRRRTIEAVVASPRFATRLADIWFEILMPEGVAAGREAEADELRSWLRSQFAARTPYDKIVSRFLTAGGPDDAGPAAFYVSMEARPEKVAAATSEIFLGIQMRCAQCHDHPFAVWKQRDFWEYAAFFAQLELEQRGNRRFVRNLMSGEVTLPDSTETVPASYPGRETPVDDRLGSRRKQLSIWMSSPANPFFARAAVNHVWRQMMGRPLYEIDGYGRSDDQPRDPRDRALQLLADDFAANAFDLSRLYRIVAMTRLYGLANEAATDSEAKYFASMPVKTLSAAQFFDSMAQNVYRQQPGGSLSAMRMQFLARMESPGRSVVEYPHGVTQVLALMNGPETVAATGGPQAGLVHSLSLPLLSDDDRIDWLFLSTLSRWPTEEEREVYLQHLSRHEGEVREEAFGNMVWALVNSTEFAMCP